jgi:hypothetical protein
MMETIKISDEALRRGAEEGMDGFLQVFIDKYLEVTGGVINAETMPLLNGHQHTLLGYHFLREELNVGGFVQLIQNGYGPYIFDNPFAKAMRLFGLKEFSKLIYAAKKIYDENKADLEKERDDDEFYMEDLIGFKVTAGKLRGEIVDYYDSELNPLFGVDFGQGEHLIPAAEEFIAQINFEKQTIKMILPDGLLEL